MINRRELYKSNTYFLNCVRDFLDLEPLPGSLSKDIPARTNTSPWMTIGQFTRESAATSHYSGVK